MKGYYVLKNGLSEGPISYEEVLRRFQSGEFAAEMLFWCAEQSGWQPLSALLAPKPVPGLPPLPDGSIPVARPTAPPPQPPITLSVEKSVAMGPGQDAILPRPWRRYFARLVDMWTIGGPAYFLFSIPVYMLSTDIPTIQKILINKFFAGPVSAMLMIPVCAFFLSSTGTTPGKWCYGVRVMARSGKRLSFEQAMKRESMVFAKGLGFGIPFVNLAMAYQSSRTLTKKGNTEWDDAVGTDVISSPASFRLFSTICLSFVAMIAVATLLVIVGESAK